MIKHTPRNLIVVIVISIIIFGLLTYLGVRTIRHEALLRHYQIQTVAKTRVMQASQIVTGMLNARAQQLNAVSLIANLDQSFLKTLLEKEIDIEQAFLIEGNRVVFPDERGVLNQAEKAWLSLVMPILHDSTVLHSHMIKDEKDMPRAGWYITLDKQEPVLIYWRILEQKIVGFRVSYIKFMSDVLNAAEFDFSPDLLIIRENGRIFYQSSSENLSEQNQLIESRVLDYPLNNWQIEYFSKQNSPVAIYLWGGFILCALLALIALVIFRIYREYTQTVRLASQQVSFVGQVSHELKTPLTNIALYAELLREEIDEDNETGVRYVDVIVSEGKRLSRLIQNILSFTHSPKLHFQNVDLNRLLQDISQTFKPSFEAKGMVIKIQADKAVSISSDIDRLTQIISNFLSNAEKYAANGEAVDLSLTSNHAHVDIKVRDYGLGISDKEIKKIFHPFYRVRSEITEGVSGTGIGLTIAKQLAQNLGGEILVARASPGMIFTLRLPLQQRSDNFGEKESTT